MTSRSHIPPVSNKAHRLWWQRQRKGKYFCVKFTQYTSNYAD